MLEDEPELKDGKYVQRSLYRAKVSPALPDAPNSQ